MGLRGRNIHDQQQTALDFVKHLGLYQGDFFEQGLGVAAVKPAVVDGANMIDHDIGVSLETWVSRCNANAQGQGMALDLGDHWQYDRRRMTHAVEQVGLHHQHRTSFARFCAGHGMKCRRLPFGVKIAVEPARKSAPRLVEDRPWEKALLWTPLRWRGKADLSELKGKRIQLRVRLSSARIFGYRLQENHP